MSKTYTASVRTIERVPRNKRLREAASVQLASYALTPVEAGGESFFELDDDGNVKLKDEYGGLWAAGFISAGGLSDSSGGGGIDALAMWKLLTNNNSLSSYDDNTKIAVAHIPDLTASKISDLSTWLSTNSYAKTTDIPSALKNPYSLTIGSVSYDGSAAKTVAKSDITTLLNWGTVGSSMLPVYINSGEPTAITALETTYLKEPTFTMNATLTEMATINTLRANRFALLPGSQVIIEKSTDGGTTWQDYGASNTAKGNLFSGIVNATITVPKINNVSTSQCLLRITWTAMKYTVPDGTAETGKYAYWNSSYVSARERYNKINALYIWHGIGGSNNRLRIKFEKASGSSPNTWTTVWNETTSLLSGNAGGVYITFNDLYFGGSTTQTSLSWNLRLTVQVTNTEGDSAVVAGTGAIYRIQAYGQSSWDGPALSTSDHLYTWDNSGAATFPAGMTLGGNLSLGKNSQFTIQDSDGTGRSMVWLDSSNVSHYSYTLGASKQTKIYGSPLTLCYGSSRTAGITLDSGGTTTFFGAIILANNKSFYIKNSGGTVRDILLYSSSNNLVIGYGAATDNGDTKIYGGSIYLCYSSSRSNGLSIASTGATTLYKATTLSETLTVTGATTLNNTLTVAEDANLNHGANLAYGYALRSKNSAGTSNLSMMYLSSGGLIIGDGTTQASNNTELRGNNIILKYSASATQGLKINSSGRIFIGASDTADSASGYANGQYLVWDSTNKAWHLVGNFYADGFISAGGLSSSSGGGGIDADAMWTLLANTDSSHKINFAHIPDLSTDTSWTNSDRGIGFSNASSMGAIRFYNTDSSKGLTYNPSTGELKAGAFVKRGGTSSQILLADGTTLSTSGLLTTAGGTLTGALTLPTGSAASTTTAGLNIGSVGHIGAASSLLGIYSTGNIVLRPNGASSPGYGLELTDTDITFNGVGLFRYGSYLLNDTTVDTIPTTYDPGMYSLTINNVEYNAILHGVDRNSYWFQMRFKPYYGNDIWYRTRNTTAWRQFAFTDSTVAKANQLATSRSLWGNSFNGTADISGNIAVVLSGTDNAIVRATNDNGSISIIASSNRGLYDNTSSRWLIATNGTYNWIPNTVNLGIGTTTPAYTLDVVGAGYFSGGVNLANGQALRAVDNPSSGTAATRALAYLSTDNIYYLGSGTAAVGYDTRISGNNIVFRYSNQLSTGATLTSTGNFQVANSLELTNSSAIAHISFGRTGNSYILAPNSGSAIAISAGTSTLSRAASELFIESGHVQVTNALHLGNTTNAKAATMVWDETNNAWKLNGNFYATGFISAGGLSNSGGIDLTAVASNILPDTTDTRNLGSSSKMWSTTYTRYIDTASGYVLRIKTAGTQRMAISASGSYVGIGSDPNSSYSLYTSGAISCSSLTQRSDERLKDIIGDVELSVSDIAKAPAVFFRWKKDGRFGAGSIAQWWEKRTPWCVIDDGKELAMDYGQISLLSVINVAKAVESHEQKIKRLETTVAAQQEEINRLRALTN